MISNWLRRLALLENLLRFSAAVVLVVGLVSSFCIWQVQDRMARENAGPQFGDADVALSPLDSRKQLRDLELYGGKGAVLMEEAKELFHGKALAKTIAVSSIIAAAGLFLVTVRAPE